MKSIRLTAVFAALLFFCQAVFAQEAAEPPAASENGVSDFYGFEEFDAGGGEPENTTQPESTAEPAAAEPEPSEPAASADAEPQGPAETETEAADSAEGADGEADVDTGGEAAADSAESPAGTEDTADSTENPTETEAAENPDAEAAETPTLPPENTAPPATLSPLQERRVNTLRYGTETEIAALIQTLRSEKDPSLDDALAEIAASSKNRTILTGILTFFGEREKKGLEDRAIRIINERDIEANETVQAAVEYLGRVNAVSGLESLRELINSGETRFLGNSIRAFGRAAKGGLEAADSAAQFLIAYYDSGNPSNENQREIVIAIGETGSSEGVAFLSNMIANSDERVVLRMAALDALGKIGDPTGLDTIIEAVSAEDPNVRATAIAALGPFSGDAADRAILEGFRDSYYRTRIGAAQAAAKRKMEAAVPYLQFRAENDDVAAAKDEAIKALGAIWNSEAIAVLEALFFNRNLADRVRILSGEMLLRNDSGAYSGRAIVELEDAKTRNQTALYNGLLRILGPGISPSLEALAKRFLVSGTVAEKSYAMDIAVNNNFVSLEADIRACLDERSSGGLSRKAQITLEKMGLAAEAP